MKESIVKASVIVVSLTLIAKIIGFLKSVIQASYFGTTLETDAFNVANGFVSNILYMIATAIAVSFVPLYIQKENTEEREKFASSALTIFTFGSVFFTVFLVLLAPFIVKIICPSYTNESLNLTILYFRVISIGVIFSIGVNLYTKILDSEKIYGYSSLCSIINSLVLILMILGFASVLGVWSLVISVPLSYFVQWISLLLRGKKYGRIKFERGRDYQALKLLAIQATPILISQSTVEINQIVDRALLASTGIGTVTAVAYSAILYQFASTLVTAPLTTVVFTELSIEASQNNSERIKELLNRCYKILLLFCVPVISVMIFCSEDIVTIVYGHGKFDEMAIEKCCIGLEMYGLCLLPVSLKAAISRAYYAANDTKRPMIMGILEVALNITLSILMVRPFGIYGVVGATTIASIVFITIMMIDYNRSHLVVLDKEVIKSYWKMSVATVLITVFSALFCNGFFFYNFVIDFIIKSFALFSIFWCCLLIMRDNTIISLIMIVKKD